MITKDFYESKMREVIQLLDSKISKKTVELIYEKIRDSFENEDLSSAIDEVSETANLSYPNLVKLLRKHASIRLEREASEQKKIEEENTRRFWQENYRWVKDGICNRKCFECPVKFCDIVASHSIEAIKAVLKGERKYEEIKQELTEKFPELFGEPF